MKKIFIIPEVETVELTPAESIMAVDLARSAELQTSHHLINATETNADYEMWKGFNN